VGAAEVQHQRRHVLRLDKLLGGLVRQEHLRRGSQPPGLRGLGLGSAICEQPGCCRAALRKTRRATAAPKRLPGQPPPSPLAAVPTLSTTSASVMPRAVAVSLSWLRTRSVST
jgi:hypothetical protein